MLSPLRYPGGKRRLVRYIERWLAFNELRPTVFVEPFTGGAAVSLHVLERDLADEVILADLDPLVAAFWKTVFDREGSQWLIERILTTPVTLAKWRSLKRAEPKNDRERAFTCLFLNRTSFSGILHHRAGPIGGMQQVSAYGIDCRFPRERLARRIHEIAKFSDRVRVWHKSWRETVSLVSRMQDRGTVAGRVCYYCDPPFFNKAALLYRHIFRTADHEALRDTLLAVRDDWCLSYDVAEELHKLWKEVERPRANIELLYQMPQRIATEAILSNLDLPGGDGPIDAAPRGAQPQGAALTSPPSARQPMLSLPVVAWTPVKPRSAEPIADVPGRATHSRSVTPANRPRLVPDGES